MAIVAVAAALARAAVFPAVSALADGPAAHASRDEAPSWRAGVAKTSALSALPGVRDVRVDDSHLHLSTSELHRTVPALLDLLRTRQFALTQLGTHSATLEDVFVTLTGRQLRDE